mmetsp:Transcript_136742/g.354562  ORF Transcript_136742/g.354562 Transcript_136742/m.354562 type:complete len:335 (+) Transcript_136742:56-1060(+)
MMEPAPPHDGAPFTRPAPSLEQALALHGFAWYAPAFQAAQIDAELAQTMTAADLRALLPEAPLGHCLRMQLLFKEAFQRQPALPASPAWRMPAMLVAQGQISGNLAGSYEKWCDNVVIFCSLQLGVVIEFWMELIPECEDGTSCETLRMVDFICWTIAASFLFMAAFSGFLGSALLTQLIREEDLPVFMLRNWALFSIPALTATLGTTCSCAAMGTRALVTLDETNGPIGAAAMGLLILSMFAFFWRILIRCLGLSVSEVPAAQLGFLGLQCGSFEDVEPDECCSDFVEAEGPRALSMHHNEKAMLWRRSESLRGRPPDRFCQQAPKRACCGTM